MFEQNFDILLRARKKSVITSESNKFLNIGLIKPRIFSILDWWSDGFVFVPRAKQFSRGAAKNFVAIFFFLLLIKILY